MNLNELDDRDSAVGNASTQLLRRLEAALEMMNRSCGLVALPGLQLIEELHDPMRFNFEAF